MYLGAGLAKKKKAVLADAKENTKDGILYYTFVFKAGDDKKGAREVFFLNFCFVSFECVLRCVAMCCNVLHCGNSLLHFYVHGWRRQTECP